MAITEGIFPGALKIATVIPFHIGDSWFTVSNFRQISLLLTISKMFEKTHL